MKRTNKLSLCIKDLYSAEINIIIYRKFDEENHLTVIIWRIILLAYKMIKYKDQWKNVWKFLIEKTPTAKILIKRGFSHLCSFSLPSRVSPFFLPEEQFRSLSVFLYFLLFFVFDNVFFFFVLICFIIYSFPH